MYTNLRKQPPIPNAAYATSKVAAHWLTKRMDAEEEKLAAFVVSPGWCQPEMGNSGAVYFGVEQAPVTVEESCSKMVELIDAVTKESHGGRLWDYAGEQLPW